MRQWVVRVTSCSVALALIFFMWLPQQAKAAAVPPEVEAEAYVLMDAATGQVLISKNANLVEYPASITKVLTVALALENCDYPVALDAQIEVSYPAVHSLIYNAASIALTEGEVVSLRDMLYAALIESGNDAANVLAEYTAGSMEAFAGMMNAKAASLGLTDSNFVNANGLPDASHITTAYDMAVITRWALTVQGFREIFNATNYTMPPTNKQPVSRGFNSSNLMLIPGSTRYYSGITGSKSGYTDDARYTLVTSAQRDGTELVCVVLKCPQNDNKYTSTTALLNYGFDNFTRVNYSAKELTQQRVPVYGGSDTSLGDISVCGGEDVSFLLHNSLSAKDVLVQYEVPEKYVIGQPFAPTAVFMLPQENPMQEVQLLAVPLAWTGLDNILAANTNVLTQAATEHPAVFWTLTGGLAILAILFVARVLYVQRRRKKRRDARLARVAAARAEQEGRIVVRYTPKTARYPTPLSRPRVAPGQNGRRTSTMASAVELRMAAEKYTGTYGQFSRRSGSVR